MRTVYKQYEKKASGFDDGIMREAIDNVAKKNGTDWKAKRNCQDFVDEALEEYFRLQKERKKQQPPAAPQPIPKAP